MGFEEYLEFEPIADQDAQTQHHQRLRQYEGGSRGLAAGQPLGGQGAKAEQQKTEHCQRRHTAAPPGFREPRRCEESHVDVVSGHEFDRAGPR